MKKSDIVEILKEKRPDLSKNQLNSIVNQTFEAIIDALSKGDRIEIRGLGTFKVKEKPAKVARNPKTGKNIFISSRKTVKFKPSKVIKKALKEG